MHLGRGGERPAFDAIALHNLRNLIGQLFVNAPIGFCIELRSFRDRSGVVHASAITHRKTSRLICHLIDKSAVRIGNIEGLHELQTRPARGRFVHSICF